MHRSTSLRSLVAPALLATALGPVAATVAAVPQEAREVEIETTSSAVESYRSQVNGGPSVSLRVEDGEVVEARVGDEVVPVERVFREEGAWVIRGADGGEIARFGGGAASAPRAIVRRFRADGDPAAARAMEQAMRDQMMRDRGLAPGGMPRTRAMIGAAQPKAMMGIGLGPVDGALAHHLGIDPARATTVTYLVEGAPAQKAGLERFDVIVSVDGDADASPDAIRRLTAKAEAGAKVAVEVLRRGERKSFEVELAQVAPGEAGPVIVEGEPAFEWRGEDGGFAEIEAMLGMGAGGEDGEGMVFFFGPDGERQELRIPTMRGMPPMPALPLLGMQGVEAEAFEQQMEEFARRMEAWGERFERRMAERMRGGRGMMPGGDEVEMELDGGIEVDGVPLPPPRRPRLEQGGPRWEGAPRRDAEPRRDAGPMNEDRIRRLEEQMERLMRELEKANARNGRAPNDA